MKKEDMYARIYINIYIYIYLQVLLHSHCIITVLYRKTDSSALDSYQFIVDKICIIAGICWQILYIIDVHERGPQLRLCYSI